MPTCPARGSGVSVRTAARESVHPVCATATVLARVWQTLVDV